MAKKSKLAMQYKGKDNTFIKVKLLPNARKGNYKKDVISMEIQSVTDHIAGDMTEEEAIILANGLINAVTLKLNKEKRI